jgi:hypothetical protein
MTWRFSAVKTVYFDNNNLFISEKCLETLLTFIIYNIINV